MGVRRIEPLVARIAVLSRTGGTTVGRITGVVVEHVGHHLRPPTIADRRVADLDTIVVLTCDSTAPLGLGQAPQLGSTLLVLTTPRLQSGHEYRRPDHYQPRDRPTHAYVEKVVSQVVVFGRQDHGITLQALHAVDRLADDVSTVAILPWCAGETAG